MSTWHYSTYGTSSQDHWIQHFICAHASYFASLHPGVKRPGRDASHSPPLLSKPRMHGGYHHVTYTPSRYRALGSQAVNLFNRRHAKVSITTSHKLHSVLLYVASTITACSSSSERTTGKWVTKQNIAVKCQYAGSKLRGTHFIRNYVMLQTRTRRWRF